MNTFKPSQVDITSSFPPLVATMGKCEREIAAAIIVRACQENGDTWAPVSPVAFKNVMREDISAKREPLFSISTNPFARPDFTDLVATGSPTLEFRLYDAG